MAWCCLLAHGERKLVRVASIFPEAGERVERSIRTVSVEEESFRDGFVVDCMCLVAFLVAVDGILALPQMHPLIPDSL